MIDWNNDPLEQTIPNRKDKPSLFWDYVVPIFLVCAVGYFIIRMF